MSDKRTSRALVAALALLLVFAAFGCQKLSVKKLTANYHFNKANALFIDNKYSKAIVEYKTALENNPELIDAYRFLGESYKALYVPGKESAENKERADEGPGRPCRRPSMSTPTTRTSSTRSATCSTSCATSTTPRRCTCGSSTSNPAT